MLNGEEASRVVVLASAQSRKEDVSHQWPRSCVSFLDTATSAGSWPREQPEGDVLDGNYCTLRTYCTLYVYSICLGSIYTIIKLEH